MIQIYTEEIKILQKEKEKLKEEIYFLREMLEYKTLGTLESERYWLGHIVLKVKLCLSIINCILGLKDHAPLHHRLSR